VKAARDRYDGIPRPPIQRNPWNEIECGGHYARAMSSWSLLLALSGWEYDGPRQALRVTPRHTPENFKGFFTGPEGWGSLHQSREGTAQRNEVSVREGRLAVTEITLNPTAAPKHVKVECGGKTIQSTFGLNAGALVVSLRQSARVEAGQILVVRLG
jgi:hypothetical protein